ncbi:MAG TPA: N-acetylglucosamine-6-phosphate deacetylase [Victivallales bacterium]|nr:N-acetylglucosamine-6-phosphate deacetylase [Victivallales bacterium]
MKTLIKNARIISPGIDIKNASIVINKTKITDIILNNKTTGSFDRVIDAKGRMTVPGFIDIHVHGGGGSDVMDGTEKAITTIAKCKLKEGVTSFLPTTMTMPQTEIIKSAEAVERYRTNRIYAKSLGMHLEGPYINSQALGSQNPKYVRPGNINEVKQINDLTKILKLTLSPDIENAVEFVKELLTLKITPSCTHTEATYNDFKKTKNVGLVNLTHFCNRMTPLHHREIGMVGAGFSDDETYIEMICDTVFLCSDMIKLTFKLKNIDKIMLITDAMAATWLSIGIYNFGGQVVAVNNTAAYTSSGTLAASTLKYNSGLKNIYDITGLPLHQLIKTTSYNQAKSLGIEGLGKIEIGYSADINILDDDFVPEKVFVDGEMFEANKL